jgi:hypothetical protein
MSGLSRMRRTILLAAVAAAACAPAPRRVFPLGLLGPVSARIAAAARGLGLEIAAQAPPGAAAVSAARAVKGGGEVAADWSRLRFRADAAIVGGSSGVFIRLPSTPDGRDLIDYVEEAQAVDRVFRELLAARPILEGGAPAPAPFAVPAGVELRAWAFQGRLYVLLVNVSDGPLPLEARSLASWRALFSVRADPRQDLDSSGGVPLLEPGGVLWLEGRLLPDLGPSGRSAA